MDEYKKNKISEKIASAVLEIIKKEIDAAQEISDLKSMENFFCDLAEMLCIPLVQMINKTVKVIRYRCKREEDAEKIALTVGNVEGVESVDNNMTVAAPTPESRFHTVVAGDWLSKIAKTYYDDASKFDVIFEANKPMLSDPDKIYPGQVLRIPNL